MQKKILVVEDDAGIRKAVVDALSISGYEVRHTARIDEAYEMAMFHETDLVLLDLVLPAADGRTLLKRIREKGSPLPVIIMTACGFESERIHGLESGADDYVVKPFSVKELIARVEAVLRRSPQRSKQINSVRFQHGRANFGCREIVFDDGTTELLTERESELLAYLVTHANRIVSRDEILRHVWKLKPEGLNTRTVDMHIARLREKLKDNPESPSLLLTLRGQGYRFQPDRFQPEESPSNSVSSPQNHSPKGAT